MKDAQMKTFKGLPMSGVSKAILAPKEAMAGCQLNFHRSCTSSSLVCAHDKLFYMEVRCRNFSFETSG